MNWYKIENIETVDSPSLVLYKAIVLQNITQMIEMIGGEFDRLMPHVKTNKCTEVVALMVDKGIFQFKASTIAEAEMAARAGAKSVLIAHQLVGPKLERFIKLSAFFPNVSFSFLLDNLAHIAHVENLFEKHNFTGSVYIDVNNGMDRSGAEPKDLDKIIERIENGANLKLLGLHIYDGHHREEEYEARLKAIENDIAKIDTKGLPIITGGSPAFNIHLHNKNRICSPGTSVFWDWGYGEKFKEQAFSPAAIVVTRVISKPTQGIITIDLGHKAIAAENQINKRVKFLNLQNYELISQSEEHGVLKVKDWNKIKIGDVLYGVPYHVCPTVNLYDEMAIIDNKIASEYWQVIARKRKITI